MLSIFTFLGEMAENLSALAIQAEADIWSNPRSTLTQGRLFSEEMAITVSKMEKVEPVYAIKPNERMHILARRGVVSEEIKESFEWLRRQGNIAAHDVKPIPQDLALTAHRHMFTLALWFVESYGSLNIELPVYSMPLTPKPEKYESRPAINEQLEQLLTEKLEDRILPTLTEQFKQLQDSINRVTGMAPPVREEHAKGKINNQVAFQNHSLKQLSEHSIEVGEYLLGKGCTIIDKRTNGGALWVIGGWELKDELLSLKSHEIYFKFAKNGSQSTKRKPAWFMLGKDPTQLRWINKLDAVLGEDDLNAAQEENVSVEIPSNGEDIINRQAPELPTPAPLREIQNNSKLQQEDDAQETRENQEIRKSFFNKELVFPASMANMSLDDLNINGSGSLLEYLKEECKVSTIRELPEDLPSLIEKINGVGLKSIERFIKQLEEAIQEERRLIGSSKRKEGAVIAYRELKMKLGSRPTYIQLHQLGRGNSQEYRQLFDSYTNFLLQLKELEKQEVVIAKKYRTWFEEIENTIMRKSYKMVLLLSMLERGVDKWMEPITAEVAAPFFYTYYMSDENRKRIDFSDNETKKLWDTPLERTAQLIARMPMTHFAKSAKKLVRYTEEGFSLGIQIRESDNATLYAWTREICEYRLQEYFERKA